MQRAAERKLEIPDFLVTRYYLAFLKGDQAGMEREIDARPRKPEAEDWMSHNQALVLGAFRTNAAGARILWERAIALAQQAGKREKAAIYQAAEAVCEAHFGNCDRGERARPGGTGTCERAAMWSMPRRLRWRSPAMSSGSQRLAADLAKRFPEDTPVQFEYLPTLRALSALSR